MRAAEINTKKGKRKFIRNFSKSVRDYLLLSVERMPAVVIVGNTLSMEMRESWYTPAHVLGLWGAKLRREPPKLEFALEA